MMRLTEVFYGTCILMVTVVPWLQRQVQKVYNRIQLIRALRNMN